MARPSSFTEAQAEQICALIAEGVSLRQVCQIEEMPDKSTVLRWLRDREEFRVQYARAKQEGAEVMAEEILDIADDGRNDWEEREGRGGTYIALNREAIERSKLRVDARKWVMSKLLPKKYGDKLDVAHTGDVKISMVNYGEHNDPV